MRRHASHSHLASRLHAIACRLTASNEIGGGVSVAVVRDGKTLAAVAAGFCAAADPRPVTMATPMPLLVSERLRGLADGTAWLGGGEPDLKLRVDIRQFVASMQTAWPEVPVVFADVVGPERET